MTKKELVQALLDIRSFTLRYDNPDDGERKMASFLAEIVRRVKKEGVTEK